MMAEIGLGQIWPSRAQFADLAATGRRVIPVVKRYLADQDTPVSLYRKLARSRPGTFLLESVEHGGLSSRYSIIGVAAQAVLTADDAGQAVWQGRLPDLVPKTGPVLEVLRQTLAVLQTDRIAGLPPLTGGLVGALGYDIVRYLENLPATTPDELQLPPVYLVLATDLAVLDHRDGTVYLIANAINQDNRSQGEDQAYAQACQRLDQMVSHLAQPVPSTIWRHDQAEASGSARRRTSASDYIGRVEQAKGDITDGEVFQIVLAQRFEVDFDGDPLDVYRVLRSTNPSPYMYFLSCFDQRPFFVVGASPEALVTVRDQAIVTHPIAGSRPRGANPEADAALAAELLADPKERAEHVMLVDLARNDLARVAQTGSVDVIEFMAIERYSHIMHIVSTVTAQARTDVAALDVLCATFPAGTLSGAPKVRAMELIEGYEPARRGIYGGTVGYLDFAGNLDMAIAIRTAVIRPGIAYVAAGAGIVADSDPAREDRECQDKAAAVVHALAVAQSLRPIPYDDIRSPGEHQPVRQFSPVGNGRSPDDRP